MWDWICFSPGQTLSPVWRSGAPGKFPVDWAQNRPVWPDTDNLTNNICLLKVGKISPDSPEKSSSNT